MVLKAQAGGHHDLIPVLLKLAWGSEFPGSSPSMDVDSTDLRVYSLRSLRGLLMPLVRRVHIQDRGPG